MTLALDGGTPVRTRPWPSWPPPLDAAQRRLLAEVVKSGRWGATEGRYATELAARFAADAGVGHGVAVSNGTLALFAALRALGVQPGDEVIIPSYTFVACATSVLLTGATPAIVDVDAGHLHLDPDAVAAAAGPRAVAVMPVHLAGSPADMAPLLAVAARHGLAVVEDCAQAHGARYRDHPVGGFGDAGMFSFQSSKAMTAGEGGVVVFRDHGTYARAWSTANVGRRLDGAWYEHPEVGWNLRLTELQAAILLPWLERLDTEIDRREAFCARLADLLAESGLGVSPVPWPPGTTRDSRHLLMLRLAEPLSPSARDRLVAAMAAEGVPVDAGYPPLGTLPAVTAANAVVHDAPATVRAAAEVVWLRQPMLMAAPEEAADVVAALARVLPTLDR
ncbi:MAG: DegT/DnrJ/EryC1/StrS family aminotransferase [Micromonosporaceae bacterium]